MKTILKFVTIAVFFMMLHCGLDAFGQNPPPPPPGGGGAGGAGNVPGGGTPIGSGITIMLLLGAAYGSNKLLQLNKNENNN
ncbi:MAG: hypothetical protein IH598_00320 [Bacteroidales bacterium]|nr:hypothetical protein [Bacteroidales bacterium]